MPKKARQKKCTRWLWRRWKVPLDMIVSAFPLLVFWSAVGVVIFILLGEITLTFITSIIGFVVQQWSFLAQERKARDERRRGALEEVKVLGEILRSGDYAHALSLYRDFRERLEWGAWQDLEVEGALKGIWLAAAPAPLKVWSELSDGHRELRVERECIEALVWAGRLGEKEAEQRLEEVISKESSLCQLVEALGSDPSGIFLLRNPVVGKRLDHLRREKKLGQEQKKCMRKLRTLRRKTVRLPSLWDGVTRPPDPLNVAEAWGRLGFEANPFGPEQAEQDPWLKDYGIWPHSLERVRGARPALVFGASGVGKTAAALILMQKSLFPPANPEEGQVFPVWLEPLVDAWPESCSAWLDVVGRAVAETLLRAGASDPYILFEQEASATAAIATLLLHHLGPLDVLGGHLRRMGLESTAHDYVMGAVRRLTKGLSPKTALDMITSLELLGGARPSGLCRTYLFVDWSAGVGAKRLTVAPSLRTLLEMAVVLASKGMYLKIFLPDRLREDLGGSWFEEPATLSWQDDNLREMLQRRLEVAGRQSLEQICDEETRQLDPDGWLVQAAKGSPRELVRLGNQMLAGAKGAKLTRKDLP